MLVLLDRSLSMDDNGKWAAATAALGTFVRDPNAAGLALGLQYLPLGLNDCSFDDYARPAVPVGLLPANAAAVQRSLERTHPDGDTPMLPALKGTMEYARALLIGDPSRSIAIALITDGQPDTCDSTIARVADVAAAGASNDPPVLTFVAAIEEDAFAAGLDAVATAGGSGRAIRVSTPATAAQELVGALSQLRDAARACRFAVAAAGDASPTAQDVAVSVLAAPSDSAPEDLAYSPSAEACAGNDAFWVDDPARPTFVVLCPAVCARVHANSGARIEVIAGCGAGAPDGGPSASHDGGECGGLTDVSCRQTCDPAAPFVWPVCVDGQWTCPAGSVNGAECTGCTPVPHGCCEPDGTIDDASCIEGQWRCPPGATTFGSGNCRPPAVCASLMPCAVGQYCAWSDHACGTTRTAGTCKPVPNGCGGGGNTAVCGCDGAVHDSPCAAAQSGIDISTTQSCTPPPGDFACGPLFCPKQGPICQETRDLAKSLAPQSWSCVAPPAGCPTGCGCNLCPPCPQARTCSEICSLTPDGGRKLDCNVK